MTEFEKLVLQKFDNLEKEVKSVKTDLEEEIKSVKTGLEEEIKSVKTDLEKDIKIIKLTLENDISPSIKLLSELQLENSKRLINLERDVQDLKDDLAINDVLAELEKLKVN